MKKELNQVLRDQNKTQVLPFDPDRENCIVFDFSESNPDLREIDPADTEQFSRYIFDTLQNARSRIGVGGYAEDRTIYRHSELFAEGKIRSVHLGIDLWVEAGTEVLAPYHGIVHSFQNNKGLGDYGPTIILSHEIEGLRFHSLYGHLSMDSLQGLHEGQQIEAGQSFAAVGQSDVNGNWPPHLHFEVIEDLNGHRGDFPGVCAPEDREEFMQNCPDPNLVLKLRVLGWE